jgi:hypothetical protein
MRARRDAALRLLKTMLVASIVIPVTVFAYASWINYQNAVARADEQLAASLNILSQHASGIFQSVDLTFTAVDAILGDLGCRQEWAHNRVVGAIPDPVRPGHCGQGLFPGAGGARCRHLRWRRFQITRQTRSFFRHQPPSSAARRSIQRDHHDLGDTKSVF